MNPHEKWDHILATAALIFMFAGGSIAWGPDGGLFTVGLWICLMIVSDRVGRR